MKKIRIFGIVLDILFILFITANYYYKTFYVASIPQNIKASMIGSTINITFDIFDKSKRNNIFYMIKNNNDLPSSTSSNWKKIKNNSISYDLDKEIKYVFLKNEDNKIFVVDDTDTFGSITLLEVNKNKIYMRINDTFTPTLKNDGIGKIDNTVIWKSENEDIASVNENGTIKGKSLGTTKINATMMNKTVTIDVVVTNLYVKMPKTYDYDKPYLRCDLYTKEENDLLDEILKDRINDAGYKTRAGVVEAARFLSLAFPYRIVYFSENGRLTTNGVDAEGRYYHKGLYLHPSRYDNISKSKNGPATWGCYMYSGPSHGQRRNGLDCSGFISWVLYNGGFDVKDVGAGLAGGLDLTDYGKRTRFTKSLITNNKVKVGDLLSSGGSQGGHIAIIIGEDDNNYYVAESLWTSPNVGVVVKKYSKSSIFRVYYYIMLMDDYYKEDGNLTKLWY